MSSLPMTFLDVNQNGVAFLLADIDVGMTFMDVAESSHIQETVRRNHDNARKAYDTVLRLLGNLTPALTQGKLIDAKMAVLKARLEAFGQQF
jgi:hypothetical protein